MNKLLDDLLGKNNWSAHCITLERCKQRQKSFTEWANDIGLDFTFWFGVDIRQLDKEKYKDHTLVINGLTCCGFSHRDLYKHLIENSKNEYFFIFEDDCCFNDSKYSNKKYLFEFMNTLQSFKNTPDVRLKGKSINLGKWDSIWFGYHDSGTNERFTIADKFAIIKHTYLTHAFITKRFILKEFLKVCDEKLKHTPVDWILDDIRQETLCLGPPQTVIDQLNFAGKET
jgi:hypothetical protein